MSDTFDHEGDAWCQRFDGIDDEPEDGGSGTHCKYCGVWGLTWKTIDGRWRLISGIGNSPHVCEAFQKDRQRRKELLTLT